MIETVDDMPLKIVSARTYLLRVPVPALRVDAQSVLDAWDVLAAEMVTDAGLIGRGYQCGFGPVMAALKHFVEGAILPDLIGRDARRHRQWWQELYLLCHHTGLNGPAIQGLSVPSSPPGIYWPRRPMRSLWSLLGGEQGRRVPCYDTNCGWLGYTLEELLDNVSRSIDQGFRGVKVKIGVDFEEDLRRLSAVRARLGDDAIVTTDANNRWDLQTALRRAPSLVEFDIAWLEEPLYPFDVRGHAELAAAIKTPLLHGEKTLRATDDSRHAGGRCVGSRTAFRYEAGWHFSLDGCGRDCTH